MEQGIFNTTYNYLIETFEKEHLAERRNEPPGLLAKRAEAFQLFTRKGFPSIKNEDWKYTNLNRVLKTDFRFRQTDILATKSVDVIDGLNACNLVLINGKFIPELSDSIPEGVKFYGSEASLSNSFYTDKIGSIARNDQDSMLAFNAAFFKDLYVLHIEPKQVIEKPIHISHYFSGSDVALIAYRLLVITDQLSEATLVETFHSEEQSPAFVSYVSEFSVAEASVLHAHVANAACEGLNLVHHREVEQYKNSIFNHADLSLGNAAFIRNDLNCRLKESGTETHLLGTYILNGQQHVDNHSIADHQKPNCNSVELYKGIMMDRSHGVFNGKIFVRLDAQKTNAFQKNNNILLSDQATINSKPQLEIFADDVKCSHGSTVGQFDEDAIFYLRSRGIGEEAAKRMLIEAFINDVHSKITLAPFREYVLQLLKVKLQDNTIVEA